MPRRRGQARGRERRGEGLGTPDEVASQVNAFIARTGADEVVFGGATFEPEARTRSLALAMGALTA